jgi:pimeloyl-ACP methyl ester carboxylesterase
MRLGDDVALFHPVFRTAGDRFHLIGHSYGGAIALTAALTYQDRLISLVVYEPVRVSVLMANAPQSDAAREIVACATTRSVWSTKATSTRRQSTLSILDWRWCVGGDSRHRPSLVVSRLEWIGRFVRMPRRLLCLRRLEPLVRTVR